MAIRTKADLPVTRSALSRRELLRAGSAATAAAALGAPMILAPRTARAAGTVYHAGWGGTYRDALRKAFFDPFTKETGIEVITTSPPDLAKLKAEVTTGNVEWDVVELLTTWGPPASQEGMLEPIDYNIININREDLIYPQATDKFLVSPFSYTSGLGYSTERNPNNFPRTFAEFWDVDKFPGRRGLRGQISDNLEIALLADGVAPKDLYPIDIDRAFKVLDRIKPHIKIWVETTTQTSELIARNELDFDVTFSGRVFAAQKDGVKIGYSRDQIINYLAIWGVTKGAKNKEQAMKLLAFLMRPDRQAEFCNIYTYAPVTKSGYAMVSPDIRRNWVADYDNPKNLTHDPTWWAEPGRTEALEKRFKLWLMA